MKHETLLSDRQNTSAVLYHKDICFWKGAFTILWKIWNGRSCSRNSPHPKFPPLLFFFLSIFFFFGQLIFVCLDNVLWTGSQTCAYWWLILSWLLQTRVISVLKKSLIIFEDKQWQDLVMLSINPHHSSGPNPEIILCSLLFAQTSFIF